MKRIALFSGLGALALALTGILFAQSRGNRDPGFLASLQPTAGGGAAPSNLLLSNLVSYWRLDEESGTRVDAHSTNDLTDNSTVLYAAGIITNAADFEFDNAEWLSKTDSDHISLGSDTAFTLAFWFKGEDSTPGSSGSLTAKGADTINGCAWWIRYRMQLPDIVFFVGNGSSNAGVGNQAPALGTWYFAVAWHDPSADEIYLQLNDGAIATNSWSGGTQNESGDLTIGRGYYAGSEFDGLIDEFGFWKDRILTATERTWLYNSGSGRNYDEFEE